MGPLKVAKDGGVLTEAQVQALEKKKLDDDDACGEIDTAHPGYLGSQDTFYVGTLKGVGRVYQQTYVDTYCKVAQAKLYSTKTPIIAADLLNDRVLPFHEAHDLPVLRILTGPRVHLWFCPMDRRGAGRWVSCLTRLLMVGASATS